MTNPFDVEDGAFVVLVNGQGQHSLWPAGGNFAVPDGWTVAFGPAGKDACLDHVAAAWTDIRPRDLVTGPGPGPGSGSGSGSTG